MKTLQEIIDENKLVLIDTSLISTGMHSIGVSIYDVRNYNKLDIKGVREANRLVSEIKNILQNQSVATIPEVTKEVSSLFKIIKDKVDYLHTHGKRGIQGDSWEEDANTNFNEKESRESNGERTLKELQNHLYEIKVMSKRRELKIKDYKYEILLDMIKIMDSHIELKKDANDMYNEPKSKKLSLDTDERLSAMLYYLSTEETESVLATEDTDFVRLLGITTRLIGAESFLPYNEKFRRSIIENPFQLYIVRKGTSFYDNAIDSSKIKYDREFILYDRDKKESDKIKNEILSLWKDFKEFSD